MRRPLTRQDCPYSEPAIERLSRYRRMLERRDEDPNARVFSHELAGLSGASAAQVRRDLMSLSVQGSPRHGYAVSELVEAIGRHLDGPDGQRIALVGLGRLGRAVLAYFVTGRGGLSIVAGFDRNPKKIGRVIEGCRAYDLDELPNVVREERVTMGILTVPAHAAQEAADTLIGSGVVSLVNFSPVSLRVPDHVFVEEIDITTALEKAAFYAHNAVEPTTLGRGEAR